MTALNAAKKRIALDAVSFTRLQEQGRLGSYAPLFTVHHREDAVPRSFYPQILDDLTHLIEIVEHAFDVLKNPA